MLKQKLITLAAILGILACGACFQEHYTPPPPPPIVAEGLSNVGVVVSDLTESHRLNSAALAAALAQNFSLRFRDDRLSAHAAHRPEEDGFVEVKILSVTAAKHPDLAPNGEQWWSFEVKTVASLTRSNGQVLWQGAEATDSRQLNSYATEEEEMWRDPFIQSQLLRSIGARIAYTVAYQVPLKKQAGP